MGFSRTRAATLCPQMKEVRCLLGVKPISTSHISTNTYFAQVDELVERFNGTLKEMLRK